MTDAPRTRGRPARGGGPAGRDRLLRAARSEFARDGLAGASIEAITTAAGVAAPTLYHHFGSKAGLFVAVTEDAYEQVIAHLDDAVAGATSFPAAFDAVLACSVPIMRSDPSLAALTAVAQVEVCRDPALAESVRPVLRRFRAFFDQLVDRFESGTATAEARRHRALAAVTVITGLNAQALLIDDLGDVEGIVDAVRAMFGRARDEA